MTFKRALMIAGFVSLAATGATHASFGQAGQRPGEGAEQVTLQIVVEPAGPQERRRRTLGEVIRDELLSPSTYWDLCKTVKDTVTIARKKVGTEIEVAAEQFAAIQARLVRLGMSEEGAKRALTAMQRNLRRGSSWGKPWAVFVVKEAGNVSINYWADNSPQTAPVKRRWWDTIIFDDISK